MTTLTSDHTDTIIALRKEHSVQADLAADLLDLHDRTGISLDEWSTAVEYVRLTCEHHEVPFTFQPNQA